ncbi:hypothetical protein [Streptomyces sp. MNP-20]|uniref:hypothetical protein n=1 Tax=Streptomyces sp. MNP-20 TaxID=2721165 RepID=UPI001551C89A|nr:hypothetical protein [Streptomyces sp. MNP-20]
MNTPNDRLVPCPAREAEELAWQAATARVQDLNLARLRQDDADAARLFPPGQAFTHALTDHNAERRLYVALEAYLAAKLSADRLDLFQDLCLGTGDGALPH